MNVCAIDSLIASFIVAGCAFSSLVTANHVVSCSLYFLMKIGAAYRSQRHLLALNISYSFRVASDLLSCLPVLLLVSCQCCPESFSHDSVVFEHLSILNALLDPHITGIVQTGNETNY